MAKTKQKAMIEYIEISWDDTVEGNGCDPSGPAKGTVYTSSQNTSSPGIPVAVRREAYQFRRTIRLSKDSSAFADNNAWCRCTILCHGHVVEGPLGLLTSSSQAVSRGTWCAIHPPSAIAYVSPC